MSHLADPSAAEESDRAAYHLGLSLAGWARGEEMPHLRQIRAPLAHRATTVDIRLYLRDFVSGNTPQRV